MFVIVGNTTMDLFISGLDRLPDTGADEFTTNNLVFHREALTMVMGGNAANTAFVLRRLGAAAAPGSAIGADPLGGIVRDWLGEVGVDLRGLVVSPTEATPTTTVVTDEALNRLAFHHRGASATYAPADLPPELLAEAEFLFISGYPLLPAWRPDGIEQTLRAARAAGTLTALDIGPAIGEPAHLAELLPALPAVDYFLCNAYELAVCTGVDDVTENMWTLLEAGVGTVIIKQGAAGAILLQADDAAPRQIPSFAVEARFTVGAGDSFNAGFLYGVRQGWPPARAVRFGHAVAAQVVSAARGILGCPTLAEVETFLAAYGAD